MMKDYLLLAAVLFIGYNVAESSARTHMSERFNLLAEQLSAHTWSEDQKLCFDEIIKTISNVGNETLWATWIWDSIQLPVGLLYGSKYQLGNYDQCLRETVGSSQPPFRTQYCLADVVLGSQQSKQSPEEVDTYISTEEYLGTKTKLKQSFNVITWGVCVPESCQTESVKTFLRALLKQSHLGHLQTPLNITVTRCEPAGETKKHIDGFHIVLTAALLMIVVVLLCTKYVSRHKNINSDFFADNVIKCFCLKRNTKDWLQRQKNDVQVLHGIRFISSCLIILLHTFFIAIVVSAGNGLDFEETVSSYRHLINNLILVVDTFFVISGLLQVKNAKPNTTLRDLVQQLIKRYFRLIWWYIVSTLLLLVILPRSGCGPLCARFMSPEYEHCIKGWWAGLLLLGNYIRDAHICNPVTWYIFCDFQLTVFASILIWLHNRSVRVAVACFSVAAALSILLTSSIVYNMPEIINLQVDFDFYQPLRTGVMTPTLEIYQRTHHRAIPYLVGMVMGYVMSNYKPETFRITFTKKQLSMYILSIMLLGMSLFSFLNENFKAAILIVTTRLVYAGMVCALIAVSEYGYLPYLQKMLSWSMFVPLSKLTYGVYMIHCITIGYAWCSARSPLYVNGYILTEKYLGNLTLANLLSLFFLLFVETPLNNLVKLLCSFGGKPKTKTEPDGGDEIEPNGVLPSDSCTAAQGETAVNQTFKRKPFPVTGVVPCPT